MACFALLAAAISVGIEIHANVKLKATVSGIAKHACHHINNEVGVWVCDVQGKAVNTVT
jgi:hypothetical protein